MNHNSRVEAVYYNHADEGLNDNPLSQAIPVIESHSEVTSALQKRPIFQKNFWDLSPIYQKTQQRLLTTIHEPHSWCSTLYDDIVSQILFGYVERHPFLSTTRRMQMEVAENARRKKAEDIHKGLFDTPRTWITTTAPCSVGHGPSGCSKTTTIRQVLSLIPQVIEHTQYDGIPFRQDQLTWVSFDLPPTAAPKALALSFFKAVDRALNTNYYSEWTVRSKDSIEHHYAAMQVIAANHYLGFIHIDEVQFMLKYAKSKDSPTLPVIEALFNKIGVPTLLTCTSEGMELFDTTPAQFTDEIDDITTTRRVFSEENYPFSTCSYDSKFFNQLFDAFFPTSICVGGKPPTEEFKKLFHEMSAGLPAIITRLARLFHKSAITLAQSGDDQCPLTLLLEVYESKFGMLDNALEQLRRGNEKAFEAALKKNKQDKVAWTNEEMKEQTKQEKKKEVKAKAIPDISGMHLSGLGSTSHSFKTDDIS